MLLEVRNLTKRFSLSQGREKLAVDQVSFSLNPQEVLALVGRSGSGKSTIANLLMGRFLPSGGTISFLGKSFHERRFSLESSIQMIFQDPVGSLNPHLSIRQILEEPGRILGKIPSLTEIWEMLAAVELDKSYIKKFPRECSGGELQRVNIARSIIVKPKLLICDEILASLDEPKKEQIVLLLQKLFKEQNLSCLFITHNLFWAKMISTKTAVLLDGKILEMRPTKELFENPQQAYTKELLSMGASF